MSSRDMWDGSFARAVELSRFGFVLLGPQGEIVRANAPVGDLLGYQEEELIGRPMVDLVHNDDRGWTQTELDRLREGRIDRVRQEVRLLGADNVVVWAELNVHPVTMDDSVWAVALVEDARDRLAQERELRRLADTDPLTDLFNRRRFDTELHHHLSRARRYGPSGALLLIDIDGLKRINDSSGHLRGDRAIVATADVLRTNLRASDLVARIGGDEFAVLLPTAAGDQAKAVAESILEAGRRHPRNRGCVTVSIGIAPIGPFTLEASKLIDCADAAMYAVKRAGGNGCAVHQARPLGAVTSVNEADGRQQGAAGETSYRGGGRSGGG